MIHYQVSSKDLLKDENIAAMRRRIVALEIENSMMKSDIHRTQTQISQTDKNMLNLLQTINSLSTELSLLKNSQKLVLEVVNKMEADAHSTNMELNTKFSELNSEVARVKQYTSDSRLSSPKPTHSTKKMSRFNPIFFAKNSSSTNTTEPEEVGTPLLSRENFYTKENETKITLKAGHINKKK